ncbi:MAG: hypothetical protein ACOY5U_02400 [Pseudomonadota bacterium]
MTQLPGIAGEIEAIIGLDLTVRLLKRRGGTQVAIPVRAKGSKLADIIGLHATERLAQAMGPGKISLPCAHMRGARARRAEAMAMLRAGASLQQVALACDLHTRTVSNYRAMIEAEASREQLKLPL